MLTRDAIIDELTRVDVREPVRTVFLHGYLDKVRGHFYDVTVVNDRHTKEVRLMQSIARFERTSPDTALIEIPVAIVNEFSLQAFVLSAADISKFRRWADEHNAPYLPPTTATEAERIGNVRI